jgi:D-alanyl-D-alanine carboxypeptidase/D-alanyl-D-alanine-endopeptidase (penicillin-binding protein 4)
VTLDYDDSLFGSDSWNSAWPAGYADQVTHISALWVNEGVDASGARSTTPSLQAATTFASQLTASGITVTGTPGAKQAPSSASTVASVNSAPVETLLKTALLHSDNSATEVLGRQSALAAGKPGTFAGATANLQAQLTSLGAWQSGAVLQDTSGLSRGNLVSATMLEKAWRAALTTARLQPIADAVPVAQVSGSLASRFGDDADVAGRGVVHAKTGTLTGVSSLSGWIRTADGRVVVQAFLLNNSADDSASHTWLDAAWSAVASCGC